MGQGSVENVDFDFTFNGYGVLARPVNAMGLRILIIVANPARFEFARIHLGAFSGVDTYSLSPYWDTG